MVVNNPHKPQVGNYVTVNCSREEFVKRHYRARDYDNLTGSRICVLEEIVINDSGDEMAYILVNNELGHKLGYRAVGIDLLKRCKCPTIQFA